MLAADGAEPSGDEDSVCFEEKINRQSPASRNCLFAAELAFRANVQQTPQATCLMRLAGRFIVSEKSQAQKG